MTTTVSYPSELYPAPPTVSVDLPDNWETTSLPGVAITARDATPREDFTSNVIVRVGTRPLHDQPADVLMEVVGAMQDKADSVVGTAEQVDIDGLQWTRVAVQWTDAQGLRIHQTHQSVGLPRDEQVQDFVHLTASTGGTRAESDAPVVDQVLRSVRLAH